MPNKPKWFYHWPWTELMMGAYCTAMAFVGLIGFGDDPSTSILGEMGRYAVYTYSGILVVFGLAGSIGIFRNVQATVISVYAIAAATLFHGANAWASGSPQIGLRLLAAPLMMVPLAWVWGQWLRLVKNVNRLTLPTIPPQPQDK